MGRQFFVDRPVFAWVIALVIMLAGGASIPNLPVAQYPDVAPPTISIQATYPGASAETVENSVTQIIEQQLTGVDGLLYFSSSSSSTGGATIEVTCSQATDPDTAQVQVQNKVQQALSRMPPIVQQLGVKVEKSQRDYLLIVVLYDADDKASDEDVADYLASTLQDPISRTQGVGSVQVFGSPYAMRIWLDPRKLASYALTPADIESSIKAQNTEVSAGEIGALPVAGEQQLSATVTARSKLQTPEEFRRLVVKYDASGATVRLQDVARVELGAEAYNSIRRLNGHAASGMAVKLAPGANALDTAVRVRETVEALRGSFPDGFEVAFVRDSTAFIELSIKEVVKTLLEAIVLVVIVMFVFLQSFRATLIPAIAVPVVLLGTFGVLLALDYSINTLTMFGMVLSIGLLVDDAIVVVENVERVMAEERLDARAATIKTMGEITSALIGIATVLSAVFLPMAFFGGSTGVIYRQFAVTLVASMALSVVVALTLTPALCASLLKGPAEGGGSHGSDKKGPFGYFNRAFDAAQRRYERAVRFILAHAASATAVFLIICLGTFVLLRQLPTGFLPSEDQGQAIVQINLPPGATFARTTEVTRRVEAYFREQESAVHSVFTIAGFNFSGRGQNAGLAFVTLKPWEQRTDPQSSAAAVAARATKNLARIRDAQIFTLSPPPISGLGRSTGFEIQLQAAPGTDRAALQDLRDQLLSRGAESSRITNVRMGGMADTPQLHVDIDLERASALGLSLETVNDTLSTAWAGTYVNDFIDRARVKKVYMQGAAEFRDEPSDLQHWFARSASGQMIPFTAFASTEWTFGPESLSRFNGLPAYEVQGAAVEGVSSGEAMDTIEGMVEALPPGATYDWSGLSYQERLAGNQTTILYAASVLVVFLCLAALYESWAVPLSVLLVIPLGLLGAAAAAYARGLDNDVYFQVALLTTIGLSAKNAILIVEFAEAAFRRGASVMEAAVEGARLRLRPIVMTSLAFGAGVTPLALSTGAGANSRVSIGSGILGGTISATVLATFLVPLFFVVVRRLFTRRPSHAGRQTDGSSSSEQPGRGPRKEAAE